MHMMKRFVLGWLHCVQSQVHAGWMLYAMKGNLIASSQHDHLLMR